MVLVSTRDDCVSGGFWIADHHQKSQLWSTESKALTDQPTTAAARLAAIGERIRRAQRRFGPPPERVELVAVSKTFGAAEIEPFLAAGQRVFGENRVQEAKAKWPGLRASYDD